jgi:hypothetical protein
MAPPGAIDLAPQIRAAAEAFAALTDIGCRGCLIGGLALQRWGQPRFTQDADLTVLAPVGSEAQIVDALLRRFASRMASARQHALDRRVLLLSASNGVSIDMSLAGLPFEEEVFQRATRWMHVESVWLDTCSAEDLTIYKLVAARGQDLVDIIGIVERQREKLDLARIRHWGAQFAELKEEPDLLRPFEEALKRARLSD